MSTNRHVYTKIVEKGLQNDMFLHNKAATSQHVFYIKYKICSSKISITYKIRIDFHFFKVVNERG
jgi:hypothetical protein